MKNTTRPIAIAARMQRSQKDYQPLRRAALAALAAAAIAALAYAQDIPEGNDPADNHVSFVKTSRDTTVYNILEKDRSKNVNEIPVPHFAIHTANNKFVMTIGAKFNPIFGADMGSDLFKMDGAGINFVPSQIRVPSADGRKSDLYINALNADVDLQVVGFGNTKNQITGYLKLSTNGNDKNIHLSKAYITWRGLAAGLKYSLFVDESVIPPTIDPQGPNGIVCVTVNEFGYVSPSMHGVKLGVALDLPQYYTSRGVYLGKDYQSWKGANVQGQLVCNPNYYSMEVPDIPMFIQYAKGANRVRLAGIIRPLMYRDLLCNAKRTTVGWGLSLSGNIQPVEPLMFYLQATYGKGIGNFIQDLQGLPISFAPKNDHPGEMTPTPMMGWSAGISYTINPQWQVNLMASQARVWDVAPYAQDEAQPITEINNYKYGIYGAANVFYNISSYLQIGLEYLYGYRQTWGHGCGHDNRLQFQVQFSL